MDIKLNNQEVIFLEEQFSYELENEALSNFARNVMKSILEKIKEGQKNG